MSINHKLPPGNTFGSNTYTSMLTQNDNGSGRTCVSGDNKIKADTGKEWSLAQIRVLLYLQALDIPAIHALEIALKALKHASSQATQDSEIHPTVAAMRALRNLLCENEASSTESDDEKHQILVYTPPYKICAALIISETKGELSRNGKGSGRCMKTAPSIDRKSMVPGEFDRKPWRSFFASIFSPRKKVSSKPMQRNLLHI
jgi:hypothetical protein